MLRSLFSLGRPASDYFVPKVDPTQDGPECLKDCADCTVQFPSKVKVENSRPLYGQIKEFHTHVLVATGKSDWKEKVEQEQGSLMEALDQPSAESQHGVCCFSFYSCCSVEKITSNSDVIAHHGLSIQSPETRLHGRKRKLRTSHNSAASPIFYIRGFCHPDIHT